MTAAQLHMPIVGLVPPTKPHQTAEPEPTNGYQTLVLGTAIPLALARAGMTQTEACAYMEIDQANWQKALNGNGHVSFQRLLKLPLKFWHEFLPMLAEPAGLVLGHEDIADRALMQCAFALEQAVRATVAMRQVRRAG